MQQSFGQTFPDFVGFAVVGATAGLVLSGGAESGLTVHSAVGCLVGGLLGPSSVLMPWARLFRIVSAPRCGPLPS